MSSHVQRSHGASVSGFLCLVLVLVVCRCAKRGLAIAGTYGRLPGVDELVGTGMQRTRLGMKP